MLARFFKFFSNKKNKTELYIGNLDYYVNHNELKQNFADFGKILSVKIIKNPNTGKSRGYAFIKFAAHKSAKLALKKMQNHLIRGRNIKIAFTKN